MNYDGESTIGCRSQRWSLRSRRWPLGRKKTKSKEMNTDQPETQRRVIKNVTKESDGWAWPQMFNVMVIDNAALLI